MAPSPPVPPSPMVWVTQGKTQHLALLLEENKEKALIRWDSNRKVEWVSLTSVEKYLPPRRGRGRVEPVELNQRKDLVKSEIDVSVGDDNNDDEVEVLFTINPPTPKRPLSPDDNDEDALRNCKRRLHFGMLKRTGESSDDSDNVSLDTQEDIVLADLVAARGKVTDSDDKQLNCSTKSDENNDAAPTEEIKGISTEEEMNDAKADAFDKPENRIGGKQDFEKSDAGHSETVGVASSQVVQEARGLPNFDALGELNTFIVDDDESKRLTSADVLPSPNTGLPMSSFTHKSSAYVQNLAEICHTIMNDRRWRIGHGMKPLFAWEYGDDLMAILTLSRMYQPPKPPPVRRSCACLLGCQSTHAETDGDDHTAIDQTSIFTEEIDGNDCDSRALNTYCRLFYRKGPWFRIDDIYTKYYAPRRTSRGADTNSSNGQDQAKRAVTTYFDDIVFQKALLNMKEMLSDLNHLRDQGLLRTFSDEEECGTIAGSARIDGNGALLSADERRAVIEKIGGSRKKASACAGSKFKMPSENEIMKQMSQQQSIAAWFLPSKDQERSRRLLPVRPHVNHEILSKLATAVVMTASKVEYLPASILRAKLIEVKQSLCNIIDQRSTKAFSFSKLDTCYRLREAPLRTLRRCCRLYLCATSGPGDMRGDGTNGWKSIRDSLEGGSVCLPIARFIPPPGDSTWNTIAYPGLLSRFGLAHFGFTDAYVHLPVSDVSSNADLRMEQVFSNLLSFQLWELSVEIRANVDYLMELNELILYDERRKVREAKAEEDENRVPRRSETESYLLDASDNGENVSKIHVDFLNLLQKTSRGTVISQLCMEAGVSDGEGSCESVVQAVEQSISGVFLGKGLDATDSDPMTVGEKHVFRTDCEKVIFVISVILTNVFNFCYQRMPQEEKLIKTRRCWLRHMWWEGVLAYVLWDCIPVLEKRGLYGFASRALEVLVLDPFNPSAGGKLV
ncbi:phosphodiesterase I [Fragilaria crotonensis]|nr:phosphodiesterase I [Fragilaria crotonensis]